MPSSDALIRRMLSRVDWANTKVFVEYGPGVGTFSRPILKKLPHDAQLVVIDTNPDFIEYLREDIPDPRFIPVLGSAADVRRIVKEVTGADHVDYVASGLPFSTLPAGVAPKIAAETHALLRPGGAFLVYQYSPKCRSYMAPHFAHIDHDMEWWNVPPAQLYWAWKE